MAAPELPPWLDVAFLASALQGGEDKDPQVTVTKFSAAFAVATGDNYLSRLFRVKVESLVEGQEKCTSLIIKAPFTNDVLNEMIDQYEFYDKEPNIYQKLLPIMNVIVNCEFGPKLFYSSIKNVLILSDLKEQGYEMCNRHKQLDFIHCKEVLISIAKFHAASVLCKKDQPELIKMVGKEAFYNESEKFNKAFKPWLENSFLFAAKNMKELGISDVVVDMVTTKAETIASSLLEIYKAKETGLNVLNHGDLWVNNILFKHANSGEILDIRFVDFQLAKYASPVMDLIYLIWTSANEDVRASRLQELCEIYRLTLNSTLEELGCEERLTKEELHEDLRGTTDLVLATICNMLPITVSEAGDVVGVEEMEPEDVTDEVDEKYFKHYKGKHYRAILPKVMSQYLTWTEYYK